MIPKQSLELSAVRAHLNGVKGKAYWRSLDELSETDEFEALLFNEFPRQAAALPDKVTRRTFVKLMGASLAMAGLSGCGAWRQPQETIVPYVESPEFIVPGKPLFFATAMELGGVAMGLLVENHMGRPTKVEGNPDHPASLGATDVFTQASVLGLYDPDRSQAVMNQGRIRTYADFLTDFRAAVGTLGTGARLRILTETISSPTLARQLADLLQTFPDARWHQFEPVSRDNTRAGARLAFGEDANTVYRFDQANVVLALDADFMSCHGAALRYARDFADRRRLWQSNANAAAMNRLYVVESGYSTTGSKADHRLPLRAMDIEAVARALAAELGVDGVTAPSLPANVPSGWIAALARDLQANGGASIVIVGEEQPPIVHALAHAINDALGNIGQTVVYTEPIEANTEDGNASLRELADAMDAGTVDVLMILGGNPAYTAPVDLRFAERMQQVPLSVHHSLYEDETSALATWHVPMAHYLETWSDSRAFDGTVTIIQPLVEPLYGGRSTHEMLAAFGDNPLESGYTLVRETWERLQLQATGSPGGDFEAFWRRSLHDGLVEGTTLPLKAVTLQSDFASEAGSASDAGGLEIRFCADPTIYDGRFANNGWLQELPKPIIKLTWDNAALISPATAAELGVSNEELVELRYRGQTVRAPIWIAPGHADRSVTVLLGYGRERVGRVGEGLGYNAYRLRTSDAPWIGSGLEIATTGESYTLAATQEHHRLMGRPLVRAATLDEYREDPGFAEIHIPGMETGAGEAEHGEEEEGHAEEGAEGEAGHAEQGTDGLEAGHGAPPSLYPEYEYNGYKWGMSIDLTTCVGCNACVMACNAENNIPIVGKTEIARSREMHWLRVDTYYEGDPSNPIAYHMPMPCMHCEKAPCEPVCPVAATVHDGEGLNNMIYNRCVGTRYCSNNCPYKVRRFNFLEYVTDDSPVLSLLRNPDVTVRSRGVMEKCTYCIQRISSARIEAQKEGRSIRDGEVLTACQAACATNAISFGDLNDESAQVTARKAHPLNYAMLGDLGTQPRTTYLAAVRNPNPELAGES